MDPKPPICGRKGFIGLRGLGFKRPGFNRGLGSIMIVEVVEFHIVVDVVEWH